MPQVLSFLCLEDVLDRLKVVLEIVDEQHSWNKNKLPA